jgi:AAA domain
VTEKFSQKLPAHIEAMIDKGTRSPPLVPDDIAKGFPFVTYKSIKKRPVAKPWILKGLLARGETSGWVGPPGSLKSSILTSVAVAIASGEDWCGKRNKEKCAVIYFALERADLVSRRLRAYAEQNGDDLPIAVVGLTINLMDEKVVDEIIATIDNVERELGVKVGLIIIDTLPKGIAAGGGDEDKARDQGKVYANIQRIKDRRQLYPPHVALVCHPGKDASRGPRGSNASTGDFDVQIEIAGTDTRTATITKNNDGPEGFLASFKPLIHDFGTDEDGDLIEVCLAEPIEGASAPTIKLKPSKWSKSSLCKALQIALGGSRPIKPWLDGPLIDAVPLNVVRQEFYKAYPSEEQSAKRQAWNRALKGASENGFICTREIDDIAMIWFTTTDLEAA